MVGGGPIQSEQRHFEERLKVRSRSRSEGHSGLVSDSGRTAVARLGRDLICLQFPIMFSLSVRLQNTRAISCPRSDACKILKACISVRFSSNAY